MGEITISCPVPSKFPPQEPEYQFQLPPVPSKPPLSPIVFDQPEQIKEETAYNDEGGSDDNNPVTVVFRQLLFVLQGPSSLTKYADVPAGFTIIVCPDPM